MIRADQPSHAEHGKRANVVGGEPVLALAGIEQHLQRADAQREKADAPQINPAAGALHVRRIEHKTVHQEERQHAHWQVEVEDPAPAVVVSDPSAQRRPENRRQQNADAERRHGMAVSFLGERLQKNRLGQGLQSAARQSLQHAENNQLRAATWPGRRTKKSQ